MEAPCRHFREGLKQSGGAIVALAPHGGVELTLNTMWMINHDMIVVEPGMYPPAGCITGGGAYEMLSKNMRILMPSDLFYGMPDPPRESVWQRWRSEVRSKAF
jgi:hypothetical protein